MSSFTPAFALALLAATTATSACGQSQMATANGQETGPSQEALDRRDRSNAVMRAEGVPMLASLPVIETEAETTLPTAEEVTMRAIATIAVASKGISATDKDVEALVRKFGLSAYLSPKERAFLAEAYPTRQQLVAFSWRFESAYVLLWSVGLIDKLGDVRESYDPAPMFALLNDNSRSQLLAKAELRSKREILDQADLIYRYRWALVDADAGGRPAPAGLNGDVAMERHQALNWLIYHAEQEWDEVSLDT